MMFANPKCVKADLIGSFDLLDEVVQAVTLGNGDAFLGECCGEAVNSDLQLDFKLA
jgi:hypothetical protein